MSIAARALSQAAPDKRKVRAVRADAAALLNNGKAESLPPLFAYIGAIVLTHMHRMISGEAAAAQAAIIYGIPGIVCAAACAMALWAACNGAKVELRLLGILASIMAVCAWLAAATALPLTFGLYVGGAFLTALIAVAYYLWLANYRKPLPKTELHLPERAAAPAPVNDFEGTGLAGSDWAGPEKTTDSGTVRPIRLASKLDALKVVETMPGVVANIMDANYDDVELVATDRAKIIEAYDHTRNLLATPLAWPLPDMGKWSLIDPIPLGHFRTGHDAVIKLLGRHLLIGGTSDSGKSTLARALLTIATMDPTCETWLADGKRIELRPFRHAAKGYIQDDLNDLNSMLLALKAELTRRYDVMGENDWLSFTESNGKIGSMLLMIDELPAYLRSNAKQEDKDLLINNLKDLLDRGRAAGLIVIATAQRPSAKQIDGDLRDGFTLRVAFRTMSSDGSRMILGEKTGVDATTLPENMPGMAYLSVEGKLRQFRAFWVSGAQVKSLVATAPPEPSQWGSVLPADQHYGVEDITARYPNGDPLSDGWQANVWHALGDTPTSTQALAAVAGRDRSLVLKHLQELHAKHLVVKGTEGRATVWSKEL